MLDKDLFFSLCKKYNVELSNTIDEPVLKDADGVHAITSGDVKRIFMSCQIYFDYSIEKTKAIDISAIYCAEDDFAVAC